MNTVEGTLRIRCENNTQPTATRRYALQFSRYRNFRDGAQPSKRFVGEDFLENYLLRIEFEAVNAKEWLKQLRVEGDVSIPNVMMPENELSAYEQSGDISVRIDAVGSSA